MDDPRAELLGAMSELQAAIREALPDLTEFAEGVHSASYEGGELHVERLIRIAGLFANGNQLVARILAAATKLPRVDHE